MDAALEMKELGLAKEIANVGHQDDFDKELRKKLWLRIARCVVEEEKNISKVNQTKNPNRPTTKPLPASQPVFESTPRLHRVSHGFVLDPPELPSVQRPES